jgi:hypothetical protein
LTLLAVFLLLFQSNAPAPATSPALDRNAFTFTNYRLTADIDPQNHAITAEGDITLRNDSALPQTAAALQISSSLEWKSVQIGKSAAQFTSTKLDSDIDHTGAVNEAVVHFAAVPAGSTLTLHVSYGGTVELGSERLRALGTPENVAEQNDWDRIASDITALRGVGYVQWYPVSIEPAKLGERNLVFSRIAEWKARHQESSMSLNVKLKSGGQSLVSSAQQEQVSPGEYRLTWRRFGIHVPIILASDYVETSSGIGSVFSLLSSTEETAKYAAALTSSAPSAFEAAKQVAPVKLVQVPASFAPFEGDHLFLTPFSSTATETQLRANLAHIAAHAFFRSNRAWLDEGFAHYAQFVAIERSVGRSKALESLSQRSSALALFDSGGENQQPLTQARDELFYRTKASFVLLMLADMAGEQSLTQALKEYAPERDREPSYFQRLIEKHAKRDLEQFFDDWVYRDRGLPEFKITDVYARQNLNGGFLVTVTVENSSDAGAEVPVTIRAQNGVENSGRVWVGAQAKASTRITLPMTPATALVNDGSVPEVDPSNNTYAVPAKP